MHVVLTWIVNRKREWNLIGSPAFIWLQLLYLWVILILLLLLNIASKFGMIFFLFLLFVQVEYYPLSSIEKSRAVMEDFFDIWQETVAKKSLPGHFIHVESNFSEYGLSDHYSFQHTAVQYATCLQQLMAAVRPQWHPQGVSHAVKCYWSSRTEVVIILNNWVAMTCIITSSYCQ